MSITEVAIKRPLLITVIFTVLILFGFISYRSLNYNLLPKFEANVISIVTVYPGAAPDEVESTVTKKIEDAVSSMEGLDKISSTSQEGASIVTIELKSGANVTLAQQDAQRKIDQIKSDLPDDAEDPILNKFSSDETPVLRLGVSANMGPTELFDLVDDNIKPQLANVAGVGQVNIIGGNEREIQVNINQDKLIAYNISLTQVAMAIQNANLSFPAGKVETSQNRFSIKFDAKFAATDQIRQLIVRQNPDGSKVYLSDIAEIQDGQKEVTAMNHVNGKPSVGIQILKQSDANAVNVSKLSKKKLEDLEKQYASQNLKFDIAVDQSTYTLASANAVMEDLVLAVVIVAIVMLAFLHSLRSSLFVLVALPSSMIPTFIAMYVLGFSLNLMTLMALSLVVGILVDDSIVVLENIYRHMEMGKKRRKAALEGRNEIGFTAMAITLVDIVVFVPLSLVSGLIGNILREFSLVVVFSTLMSLLVSFTITPMLASRFGKLEHLSNKNLWGRINLWFERQLDNLKEFYGKALAWVLGHKRWVFISVIVLMFGSIALVPAGFIGAAFITESDRGEFSVKLELDQQASIYQTNMVTQEAERILLADPTVKKVFSNIGYSSSGFLGGSTSNANISELTVQLVDKKDRHISTEEYGKKMQSILGTIPGVKITVNKVGITGSATTSPIEIAIKGTDMKKIREAAAIVKEIAESVPGTQYVQYSTKDPKTEIEIKLDRERMSEFGLNAYEVGGTIQTAFRGNDKSKFKQGGNEYDILVTLDKFDRSNINDVRRMSFINNQGQAVELQQFADVSETTGESVLERMDRLSSIKVNSGVVGRPVGTVGADIQKKVAEAQLPDGITIEYLGDLKRQSDAFGSLGFALIIGIVLVYLIMVALYESAVYPFVVLFAIPVALIGALLALALTMESLTIFSIVGMIMLLGLVTKNAILIVDFANKLKEEGMEVVPALIEAGKERLRPILMTTVAMIAGMLPIALASGEGAEVKNGMAWVIIGGLTSSLILTLVVVPSVYLVVESVKIRLSRNKRKRNRKKIRKIPELHTYKPETEGTAGI